MTVCLLSLVLGLFIINLPLDFIVYFANVIPDYLLAFINCITQAHSPIPAH